MFRKNKFSQSSQETFLLCYSQEKCAQSLAGFGVIRVSQCFIYLSRACCRRVESAPHACAMKVCATVVAAAGLMGLRMPVMLVKPRSRPECAMCILVVHGSHFTTQTAFFCCVRQVRDLTKNLWQLVCETPVLKDVFIVCC